MKTGNKLIVRRLVAGILLLGTSAWSIFNSFQDVENVITIEKAEEIVGHNQDITPIWNNIFASWMLIVIAIAIGIIYIVFSNKRPIKWLEYSMISIAIIGLVVFTVIEPSENYGQYIFIVLVALGAPLKKGFKGMPFATQEEAEKPTPNQKKAVKTEDSGNLQELVELKKLLDSGVITKKDFDAKKKHILGL